MFGTYYDGGVFHNNPSLLALQEVQKVMPDIARPDQLITVGTGNCYNTNVETRCKPRFSFSNGSLKQCIDYIGSLIFDGDRHHSEARQVMGVMDSEKADDIDKWFRRFNLTLPTAPPALADVPAMRSLAKAAADHFKSNNEVQDLARSLLASTFYFELRRLPSFSNGLYTCHGRILCRVPVTGVGFQPFMRKMKSMGACFKIKGKIMQQIQGEEPLVYDANGNFSKPVMFRVRSLDDQVDISLRLSEHDERLSEHYEYSISASPLCLKALVKVQGLEWSLLDSPRCCKVLHTKRKCDLDAFEHRPWKMIYNLVPSQC
jgi:hypothetical protein